MNFIKYAGKILPDLLALARSLGAMKDEDFVRTVEAWPVEHSRLAKIRAISMARHKFGRDKP